LALPQPGAAQPGPALPSPTVREEAAVGILPLFGKPTYGSIGAASSSRVDR
jgi:hypothetical protein